jgi:hypothetical protein
MNSGIALRLTNYSFDRRPSNMVVWQHNDAPGAASTAVAWKVIERCGYGWTHPFEVPHQLFVRIRQASGSGRLLAAELGTEVRIQRGRSGELLFETTRSEDPTLIQIHHLAGHDAVVGEIWRGGRVLAVQPRILSGTIASFRFPPSLLFSTVSKIEEGDLLDSKRWLGVTTELHLLGAARADIVMTGGGPGARSRPHVFHLLNVETWPVGPSAASRVRLD